MNKRLHILHLEDEPDFAELVRALFEQDQLDADLKCVGDRASFKQQLEAERFDLIISDYHLPSFTGLEALAMAKKKLSADAVHPGFGHDWGAGGD